jgi:hypothetical protein
MTSIIEKHLCYFCDVSYPHPSCFIDNYHGIWVCYGCDMIIHIKSIQENDKCCVCLEDKPLIQLSTCIHKVCLTCCKTIYFGSTTKNPPKEMNIESPDWPYNFNDDDDDDDPERIKYNEYCDFETKHFDIETKNYDELITIRNNLISERPHWMNTNEFINYENLNFRFHTEYIKSDKEWEKYNENKTKGNSVCPLCRAKP